MEQSTNCKELEYSGIKQPLTAYLQEELLHHVVQGFMESGVEKQRRPVSKPAVKMDQLTIGEVVPANGHVSDPVLHHAFQNSGRNEAPVMERSRNFGIWARGQICGWGIFWRRGAKIHVGKAKHIH